MSTDSTSGTEQTIPRVKARSKIALMRKQFAQAMEEHKKETNSNEEETLTSSDTPNGHTNGEDSPTPTENGSHTDEQNISPTTSNGDAETSSSSAKNGGQRKWKQKMEHMREMGYMRKTASNPELTSNGDVNVGKSATLPLARPAKEKPTIAQIEGLFAMYKKHRQPRTAPAEKTDTIHIPTPKPADPPSDTQAAFPKAEEKPHEKVAERPQSVATEPKEEVTTPISSKGSKRSVQFDPEEKKVLHFEESKAPASINPATKQLTDRISQLEEEKIQLEQQNKIFQDRIKSLESKQLSLKESPLNLEVAQQLRNVQGRLDLELSTKQVLKDYLAELQREIETARKSVPTQQYKMMLMVQIFVWAIIIALLFVIVMRRSTPEPSLRIPH